jgi:predicted nucleic acid-binding protein
MPYSIDTSAFLDAWVRNYPADVFPTIWQQMDRAARNGTLLASDEVLRELERKEDGAHAWVKARSEMLVGLDSEIEQHVRDIMRDYPRLVDTKKGRSVGDPFVIAVARVRNLTVITSENATGRRDVPRIPDVCGDLGIPWVRMLDFFREQQWRA